MATPKHHYFELRIWNEIHSRNSVNYKELQDHLTEAEEKMKEILETDPFKKYNFQCKNPVGPYIVDFYSPNLKLIIEVYEEDHDKYKNIYYDMERNEFFTYNDIKLICFSEQLILSAPFGISKLLLEMLETGFSSAL